MKIPETYRDNLTKHVLNHDYTVVHIVNPGMLEEAMSRNRLSLPDRKIVRGSLLRRGFATYESLPSDSGDVFVELFMMNVPANVWLIVLMNSNRYDFVYYGDEPIKSETNMEYHNATA